MFIFPYTTVNASFSREKLLDNSAYGAITEFNLIDLLTRFTKTFNYRNAYSLIFSRIWQFGHGDDPTLIIRFSNTRRIYAANFVEAGPLCRLFSAHRA